MKKPPIPTHDLSDLHGLGIKIERIAHVNQYDPAAEHRHVYFEIFLFKEGGGKHLIDFEVFNIEDYSLHFVTPGQVHQVDRSPFSSGYVLLFSEEFYYTNRENRDFLFNLPYFNLHNGSPKMAVTPAEFQKCEELAQAMLKEYSGRSRQKQKTLQSYLNIFLYHCQDLFYQFKRADADAGLAATLSLFQQFKLLVEKKYKDTKNVSEYAALLLTNPRTINEVCKKHGGCNALRFIHNRVLLEAKRLLGHSSFSINGIAYLLGFSESAQFSKLFKQHTGLSPNDWRADRKI
jgi:AraC family transcriptional regulator, transcriptional activator of pobA